VDSSSIFYIYFALIFEKYLVESKISRNVHLTPYPTRSLTPWGTAAGACFWRQSGAARRQDPAAERHGGRSLPPCLTTLGPFFIFFSFSFLKQF
jgi:hypothetical protein